MFAPRLALVCAVVFLSAGGDARLGVEGADVDDFGRKEGRSVGLDDASKEKIDELWSVKKQPPAPLLLLSVEELAPGDGATFPQKGDTLSMHYTGTLAANGKKFDSSRDGGQPFSFAIGQGQVIAGWDQGVMKLSLGERAMLSIPSAMGYGARGAGGAIPPNADLKFDVQLLAVTRAGSGGETLKMKAGGYGTTAPKQAAAGGGGGGGGGGAEAYARPKTAEEVFALMRFWKDEGAHAAAPAAFDPLPPPAAPTSGGLRGSSSEKKKKKKKYLSFEVDFGGFNNIRLEFEIIVLLARVTGRTLVMPQPQAFYLLAGGRHSLFDFFDEASLKEVVDVVSMDEFVAAEGAAMAIPAAARSGMLAPCSDNNWNCPNRGMRSFAKNPVWNGLSNKLEWPSAAAAKAALAKLGPRAEARSRAFSALAYGGTPLEGERVIHLQMQHPRYRLFGHFLPFFAFGAQHAAWRASLVIRNHVHFHERLLRVGAALVAGGGLLAAPFTALHIRRNDFQYKEAFAPAAALLANVRALLPKPNAAGQGPKPVLYISTDEHNAAYFKAFTDEYRVLFLADVVRATEAGGSVGMPAGVTPSAIPAHWVGMVEQLICTQADAFVGTRFSTFSAYIQRMRGYMSHGVAPPTPGKSPRAPHISDALVYVQGTAMGGNRPYSKLLFDADEVGETKQHWWESNAPVWGRAFAESWRELWPKEVPLDATA